MNEALQRITWTILASGAVVSGLAFVIGGQAVGLGAVVGTGIATLNWLAIKRLVGMALSGGTAGAGPVTILLFVKMAALFALCYWLLAVVHVDPLGFALGMSALVLGILVGSAGVAAQIDDATDSDVEGADPMGHEEG